LGAALDTQHASYQAQKSAGVRLASTAQVGLSLFGQLSTLKSLLRGQVVEVLPSSVPAGCGVRQISQAAGPNEKHPSDEPPGATGKGDPPNLATLALEYEPAPDLSVYNPTGPSVIWRRIYSSLRDDTGDGNHTYSADDFGEGWSQPYNVLMMDPNIWVHKQIGLGFTDGDYATGVNAPTAGTTWEVRLSGTVIEPPGTTPTPWTNNYGRNTGTAPGPVDLRGANPRFFVKRWWMFWIR
jgi:hypothetical protein